MAHLNPFAFHETDTPFPNIVLLWDNRPCAAIGYLTESTGTLVVSEPVVFLNASGEVHRALCGKLIEQVKRRAVSEGFQRLRLLLPASADDASFARLFSEHGFVQATCIVQWDLFEPVNDQCLPQDQGTFQLYDFATSPSAAREMQFAIDAILECSEDLTSGPPPTAAALLTQWQRLEATVFVYRIDQEIAGLMSCVRNPMISTVAVPSSSTLTSETHVCIEYIGVVPAFRRRQIASLMISRIPRLLSSTGDSHCQPSQRSETGQGRVAQQTVESDLHGQGCGSDRFGRILSQALRVTAYSDAANTPANCLYERSGFVQTIRHHLWCCDLVSTSDHASG